MSRIVCQFSCGAASAVATKLALAQYGVTHDVQIVNAFVKQEHDDNRRFLTDCEGWFGRQITQLRDLPDGPIVRNEGLPSCSFFCEMAEQEYSA